MNVHILVTCRNPELKAASTFVFKTLRTGFPSAQIIVYPNGLAGEVADELYQICEQNRFAIAAIESTDHHSWIEDLTSSETSPFWICDTDQVFWAPCEDWTFEGFALAGRYIPQHLCEFTGCISRARLHTSLLWLDPQELQKRIAHYRSSFPAMPFNPITEVFSPRYYSLRGRDGKRYDYFVDTCSELYHAIGGAHFSEAQLNCFDHLNCGTWIDIASTRLSDAWGLREAHKRIFAQPDLARGIWKQQEDYYEKRTR